MRSTLNEQVQRIKSIMEQVSEPVSGKCDLTKLQGTGSNNREARLWDKELAKNYIRI